MKSWREALLLCGGIALWLLPAFASERPRNVAADSAGARPNNVSPLSSATTKLTTAPSPRSIASGKPSPGPSPLIYPPFKAQLPAAHRLHAEKAKLDCNTCHGRATTSASANDWLAPDAQQCVACHQNRFHELRVVVPPNPRLRFSHAKHAARNIDCVACHGRVEELEDARGSERLPKMSVCLRCHKNDRGAATTQGGNCRLCHLSAGGVIKTRFREGLLVPSSFVSMRHDANWIWQHGDAAMIRGPVCQACHQESECVNCHDGRLRPRQIHPSDWLSLHGIEARQAGAACKSCHRSQSECLTCHLRAGLSPNGPGALRAERGRFHPPSSVWTDRPRTARHHAFQARLHMDECVSCHQERDCASCHASASVGGPGLGLPNGSGTSPHPPGFRFACGGLLARNPRPCLVCHRGDDPNLAPCR